MSSRGCRLSYAKESVLLCDCTPGFQQVGQLSLILLQARNCIALEVEQYVLKTFELIVVGKTNRIDRFALLQGL